MSAASSDLLSTSEIGPGTNAPMQIGVYAPIRNGDDIQLLPAGMLGSRSVERVGHTYTLNQRSKRPKTGSFGAKQPD